MKKHITDKQFIFLSAFLLTVVAIKSAAAADPSTFTINTELCNLIVKLKDLFNTLRTFAFIGAAFIVAKYAWEAISTGKIDSKGLIEGTKTTGISMFVGFTLLFSVGLIISFLLNGKITGCEALTSTW